MMSRVEQILNLKFYKGEDLYSDGEIEDRLLALCESGRPTETILMENRDWPILYHLSDVRENVLEWYDFDPQANLLEIGAGCGAVTGLFCRRVKRVVCNDLSKRRSTINATRHKDCGNLEIYVGNFEDLALEEKFDYVTLIGVFEYSGYYISQGEPYGTMLQRVKRFLKPGGKLILAIENKFGLKYWAGAAEDHTGRFFDGVQNYAGVKGVRTFSKPEITRLLREAGFDRNEFYYPMPDYKLPTAVYSDAFLPRRGMLSDVTVSYDRDRYVMFDEAAAYEALTEDGQFPYFANSFLIISTAQGASPEAAGAETAGEKPESMERL
ncbi:MAG: methyltransferase domain-containing protein [Lachnospiraceae bacterium]|jgi:SAM-dependent methyltransferase|nr:methyltransferase domain-containing protein [Lachnospiraceae bacterium]